MPEEPRIDGLSYEKRKRFFLVLVVIFFLALPSLIFYTSGYRLDFSDGSEQTIVSTGGMFVTTDNLEVEVYLDEEQVNRPRLFRNAYYIQNISAGKHRVVVQGEGRYTWVKELPVDSYLVIEVAAFNMPRQPHVRPVTEFVTATGTAVYEGAASTSVLFAEATSTEQFMFVERLLPREYEKNEEYIYVESLFSSSTEEKKSVFEGFLDRVGFFGFATTTPVEAGTATETVELVEKDGLRLTERAGELYVQWVGPERSVPYYFCIMDRGASTTAERYGNHVAEALIRYKTSTTTPLVVDNDRVCRTEIKIDRKQQDVFFYDFLPSNSDLVLLQLEDGLYVSEIDDRAWQNVQRLYLGDDIRVVVENGIIYIKDGEYYFELITDVEFE